MFPIMAGHAQAQLVLSPSEVVVTGTVTGSQSVNALTCLTYRLHWASTGGTVLGQDSGADGQGKVAFGVPGAIPGRYQVFATCQGLTGGEQQVGQASFSILAANATTVPTIPPTTGASTSTVRSTTSTTKKNPPAPSTTIGPGSIVPPGTSITTVPVTRPPAPASLDECEREARQAQAQLVYQPKRTMTVGVPSERRGVDCA